jgi:hypothetical protein
MLYAHVITIQVQVYEDKPDPLDLENLPEDIIDQIADAAKEGNFYATDQKREESSDWTDN